VEGNDRNCRRNTFYEEDLFMEIQSIADGTSGHDVISREVETNADARNKNFYFTVLVVFW
jgi:hypothetical protein